MGMRNATKRIVRNGLLLSLMMFYFSCGKEVFPPDSPGEPIPTRNSIFSMPESLPKSVAWGKGIGYPGNLEAMIQPISEYGILSREKRQSISGLNCKILWNRPVVDHGQAHVVNRDVKESKHFL